MDKTIVVYAERDKAKHGMWLVDVNKSVVCQGAITRLKEDFITIPSIGIHVSLEQKIQKCQKIFWKHQMNTFAYNVISHWDQFNDDLYMC